MCSPWRASPRRYSRYSWGFVFWLLIRRWVNELLGDIRGRRFLDDARSEPGSRPLLTQIRRVLREVEDHPATRDRFSRELDAAGAAAGGARSSAARRRCSSSRTASRTSTTRVPAGPRGTGSGERHGDGARADHARLLGHVDRARQRHRGSAGRGHARSDPRAARRSELYAAPRVAQRTRKNKATTTASPTRGCGRCATWRTCARRFAKLTGSTIRPSIDKFADVVAREASKSKDPLMLIQDFHFALLPRLMRERKPAATIALFWHIPWPNAETFGVCPWKQRDAAHMLAADILGFHTRYHCQNFLATVDRFVECQIDHEHMTVTLQGHVCRVVPYPISIEWPPRWLATSAGRRDVARIECARGTASAATCASASASSAGTSPRASSSDSRRSRRCSTRIRGCRGRITLLQVAAPSRSKLPAYQALQAANAARGGAHQREIRHGRPGSRSC